MKITNPQIVFEGISRPQSMLLFGESKAKYNRFENVEDIAVLERYFVDIQNLFLKNLSAFLIGTIDPETAKLRVLLEEIIKVKDIISNPTKQKAVSKGKASPRQSRNLHRRSK